MRNIAKTHDTRVQENNPKETGAKELNKHCIKQEIRIAKKYEKKPVIVTHKKENSNQMGSVTTLLERKLLTSIKI